MKKPKSRVSKKRRNAQNPTPKAPKSPASPSSPGPKRRGKTKIGGKKVNYGSAMKPANFPYKKSKATPSVAATREADRKSAIRDRGNKARNKARK